MARLILTIGFFTLVTLNKAEIDLSPNEGTLWLGIWQATGRQENWDAFVTALAAPGHFSRGSHEAKLEFWKTGENYHYAVSVTGTNFTRELEFKLGEEITVTRNGMEIKVKFSEDGNKLLHDVNVTSRNKQIHFEYEVIDDELVKTYKTGNTSAKCWFRKVLVELIHLSVSKPEPLKQYGAGFRKD